MRTDSPQFSKNECSIAGSTLAQLASHFSNDFWPPFGRGGDKEKGRQGDVRIDCLNVRGAPLTALRRLGRRGEVTRVQERMGGAKKTSEFARLFMAPGVGHCGGGAGPTPSGQLDAVRVWVEEGKAPETLTATRQAAGVTRTRPLCQYPLVAKYKGNGSTDDAANFSCSSGF